MGCSRPVRGRGAWTVVAAEDRRAAHHLVRRIDREALEARDHLPVIVRCQRLALARVEQVDVVVGRVTRVHRDAEQYFGFPFVRQYSTMLIEPQRYLNALLRDFYAAGGTLWISGVVT